MCSRFSPACAKCEASSGSPSSVGSSTLFPLKPFGSLGVLAANRDQYTLFPGGPCEYVVPVSVALRPGNRDEEKAPLYIPQMAGCASGEMEATSARTGALPGKNSSTRNVLGCLYMLGFNLLCTYAWGVVFLALIRHFVQHSLPGAFFANAWPELEHPLFFAQSLAILEIGHSLLGLVRSSVTTTFMQVFSRLQLVWLLFSLVPASRNSVALLTCVAAWSCAELLRFPFFAVQQLLMLIDLLLGSEASPREVPFLLKWLRYSGFTVLYPIGIASEVVCMCSSLSVLRSSPAFAQFPTPMPNKLNFQLSLYWAYIILLCLYVPGSVQLYNHMLKQRRKYLYDAGQDTAAKKDK
ncbi:very-long-chain (3R)-3-hydroxyacyl-CoA dehydratase hpo-8 [Cyclospora cayetanensis]|uniref:very-long-chain (3R)-3-hydroxyacyl-CoA dehydratase n=1 Tax=Cyclospora cayetanensis TaxID=88456 RepID=A0A6P6RWC3_9EIME|nr:very-long-chain (3R)-3-hydroxyacyl-CoA dehydratase hpo-8 [Cyclospora cayetanensis]